MQESSVNETGTGARSRKSIIGQRFIGPLIVVAAFAISAVAVAPFYFSRPENVGGQRVYRIPETHDLENLIPAIEEFDRGLNSGLLYTRWFATINNGYGTATGNFYPPGIYYLSSFINRFVGDWIKTLFVISLLGLAASGLTLYLFARDFYSRLPSAIAALLYMIAPYHMLDLYWRGAIPEFLGFAFIPLVLYFAYRLGSEGRLRHVAALGLLYGIYLMTHFPVAYIFTYVLAAYAVLRAIKERDIKVGLRIAGGMALAFVIASVYLLPAALEGKYAYEWASELFPYHSMYLTLMQTNDVFAQRVNMAWIVHALVLVVAIVALRVTARAEEGRAVLHTRIFVILAVATLFMTTPYSYYVSVLIPKIQVAVPPFRWLAIASVFMALLVAASIERLSHNAPLAKWQLWAYRAAVAAVLCLNIWVSARAVIVESFSKLSFKPGAKKVDSGFTPKDSTHPESLPETPLAMSEPFGAAIEVARWEPQYRELNLKVGVPSRIRLKTYNFHGWAARLDGQPVPILDDKDKVQVVEVPPGIHKLEVSFDNTWPRTAGAVATITGFLVAAALFAVDLFLRRRRAARDGV